ncbi:MAG: carboxypeptidase regulatory-like domain-containing protein [Desulfobacterales bacterium]|nr:MAG: carboxypeptidase regulatory-like domain-containing protein [Desulfobacterales bacterium]
MNRRKTLIGAFILTVGIAVIAGSLVFLGPGKYGTVEGEIADVLSRDAVWGARIVVAGKSTMTFRSKRYELKGLSPGVYTLTASARNYGPIQKQIEVQNGRNLVNLYLQGEGIPDLKGILVFAAPVAKGLQLEIRLTDSQGVAITHYPCLPFKLEGRLFVRDGDENQYQKGRKLFEGPVDLFWDAEDALAKNKGIIPWEMIDLDLSEKTAPHGVLEVVLDTPQGRFEYSTAEVKLLKEEVL